MKSGLSKMLLAASMLGGMNASMDLQTLRPDAMQYPSSISRKERKKRNKRAAIQKASRKANRI